MNEPNGHDTSCQTYFHACQPKYQENLLAMQQFVKSIPQTVFAKNNQMRTV